jgi:hypothetical protein
MRPAVGLRYESRRAVLTLGAFIKFKSILEEESLPYASSPQYARGYVKL